MGFPFCLGLELPELLGEEGLDFCFAKAEVEGLHDELLQGRADLMAACVQFQAGRLMRDEGADPASGFDKAFFFQNLVDLGDGQGIDMQFRGEFAHGGELCPICKLSREDTLLKLLLQLQVKGDAAVGVEEEHGVLVNYNTASVFCQGGYHQKHVS